MPRHKPLSRDEAWKWKVKGPADNAGLGMLYEPGNWGDLLKAAVLAPLVQRLVGLQPDGALKILDPFAGKPFYPLTEAAALRCRLLGGTALGEALRPFLERRQFPSAGSLALALAARPGGPPAAELAVYDLEPSSLREWRCEPAARVLAISSGYEALSAPEAEAAGLIIFDPYDLFDRWQEVLPRALALFPRCALLFYLYNKSPRGPGFARRYLSFRRALKKGLEPLKEKAWARLYRAPADAILPRSFHEVIVAGPRDRLAGLEAPLERSAAELAETIWRQGVAEDPLGDLSLSVRPPFPGGPLPGPAIPGRGEGHQSV
ncbi:MAG: hypothetical protein HY717_07195 [Planctomycetes bacterium]|nr:hypothetical protein [Planctomycetota bacterium]